MDEEYTVCLCELFYILYKIYTHCEHFYAQTTAEWFTDVSLGVNTLQCKMNLKYIGFMCSATTF